MSRTSIGMRLLEWLGNVLREIVLREIVLIGVESADAAAGQAVEADEVVAAGVVPVAVVDVVVMVGLGTEKTGHWENRAADFCGFTRII